MTTEEHVEAIAARLGHIIVGVDAKMDGTLLVTWRNNSHNSKNYDDAEKYIGTFAERAAISANPKPKAECRTMTTYQATVQAIENLNGMAKTEAGRRRADLRVDVLGDWKRDKITDAERDQLLGMLKETEAERREGLYCKVSEKGALSVYGLQRMPVTLYIEQWRRLLEFVPELQRFAEVHANSFTTKEDKRAAAEAAKEAKEAEAKAAKKEKLRRELAELETA